MIKNSVHPNILQFESLNRFESLYHFSTTIHGGVSKGSYETFNLSLNSGDNLEDVAENRNRLISISGIFKENLITPQQTHEDKVISIDKSFLSKPAHEQGRLLHATDAIITNEPEICIAVGTADCVPIILFSPEKKVLASVHAGWRGTVAKLVEKTITKMTNEFGCNPASLIACIGPSISQEYFEVGDEVSEVFTKSGFMMDAISYSHPNSKKTHIDLWFANELLLIKSGILPQNIETANLCTYSNPDLFFSARRQGINSGRMLTGGYIKK